MSSRIRLILGLAALITVVAVAGGTLGHQVTATSARSPYVSALANVCVATAEAASHKCPNQNCEALQGLYFCRNEGFRTKCAVSNHVCTETPCP